MSTSNYPPGVSGHEPQITGEDPVLDEVELPDAPDPCEVCDWVGAHNPDFDDLGKWCDGCDRVLHREQLVATSTDANGDILVAFCQACTDEVQDAWSQAALEDDEGPTDEQLREDDELVAQMARAWDPLSHCYVDEVPEHPSDLDLATHLNPEARP